MRKFNRFSSEFLSSVTRTMDLRKYGSILGISSVMVEHYPNLITEDEILVMLRHVDDDFLFVLEAVLDKLNSKEVSE